MDMQRLIAQYEILFVYLLIIKTMIDENTFFCIFMPHNNK